MPIVTRFAPSPTGFLHIGAARTALFNWLFARHHRGRFLLRIEDTDRVRSTDEAVSAILEGLRWLGLDWDGPPVFQFSRAARHAEAARQLLADGKAYLCYASPEDLEQMRQQARAEGRPVRYDGRWRDRDPREAPSGVAPVVRLRAPRDGKTTIDDLVQGEVTVANDQLDDMVLLRADGTPTYMLAVVVDDHDMHVSHVIRGDDHLTNTFRQYQLYQAFGWSTPAFAHIPLIHGADGAKLSKRHGAVGLDVYRDGGYLPDALFNYLLRLGWSHGDDEFISRAQAVEWFDLGSVGRSPARFDLDKLLQINAHYLRQCDNRDLADQVLARLTAANGRRPAAHARQRLGRAMDGLKVRAKTLTDLAERSAFCAFDGPVPIEPAAATLLTAEARRHLAALRPALERSPEWRAEDLERSVRDYVQQAGTAALKLKDVAQPLRASLTGAAVSPPIFEVMEILGRDETLVRLTASLGGDAGA